jgi:hypothetical protein
VHDYIRKILTARVYDVGFAVGDPIPPQAPLDEAARADLRAILKAADALPAA